LSWTGSKKNLPLTSDDKKKLLDPEHQAISLRRQCELLGLNRSNIYYRPREASPEKRKLLRLIDEIYTRSPYYGARKIAAELNRMELGFALDRKRVGRLMEEMGIEAIYPKPKLSRSEKEHVKYPYLLKGVDIERINQVWGTDITYIPTRKGHVYLVAIMDWHSRYVVSWEVSNSMEAYFCIAALKRAFRKYGYPDIFNSDQGSQFTGDEFQKTFQMSGRVRVSMDGRGRCMDNIFTERLWRSVKYEEVYTGEYENLLQAREGLGKYLTFYNEARVHQALEYKTPAEVYFAQKKGERH
jgi:putative transposase